MHTGWYTFVEIVDVRHCSVSYAYSYEWNKSYLPRVCILESTNIGRKRSYSLLCDLEIMWFIKLTKVLDFNLPPVELPWVPAWNSFLLVDMHDQEDGSCWCPQENLLTDCCHSLVSAALRLVCKSHCRLPLQSRQLLLEQAHHHSHTWSLSGNTVF